YYSFGKKDPWYLSERWVPPPADFNLSTPMNFVSTNDIIGGNSGSSVINKDLQVVGLIFDGNIESLPGNIIFDESTNRSVAVHTSGILEGLDKIYRAEPLVKELKAGKIEP
ncbi:MAG: S46 family peptidase, partial [Bacteroidota bacterium]